MQDVFKILEDAANLGNINAKLQIGWSKLFGAHMKQNVTEARKIFEEVAAQNVPFAQMVRFFHVFFSRSIKHVLVFKQPVNFAA